MQTVSIGIHCAAQHLACLAHRQGSLGETVLHGNSPVLQAMLLQVQVVSDILVPLFGLLPRPGPVLNSSQEAGKQFFPV